MGNCVQREANNPELSGGMIPPHPRRISAARATRAADRSALSATSHRIRGGRRRSAT